MDLTDDQLQFVLKECGGVAQFNYDKFDFIFKNMSKVQQLYSVTNAYKRRRFNQCCMANRISLLPKTENSISLMPLASSQIPSHLNSLLS